MPDKYGGTTHHDTYLRGRLDRRNNPTEKQWDKINPYGYPPLTHAWLDWWRDEVGDYHWWPYKSQAPIEVPWNVLGGRCPYCSNYPMIDIPDGILRCRSFPCREQNYPPHDKSKIEPFMATRDAGSYI